MPDASMKELRPVRHRNWLATPRVIMALILREMSTTYGRSPGGYLWAILEPVAGIALLTAIFSAGFRSPSLGVNFALFYATGILPFQLYMDVQGKVSVSLQFSQALLGYPRLTFVDTILARFILNTLTQLLVSSIIFGFIFLYFETRTSLDPEKIIIGYAMASALGLGVGAFNCYLILLFPVWQRVWAIANRPLFLISCIFFLFESVPEPYNNILWFNPVVHIVGMMRDGFYPYYQPTYVSVVYVMGLSMILMAAGILMLRRHHRNLLDN
ncbi:ABC transporter permease [Roseovarius sp. S4756]|uniref:ABC transporter permease n=1 Tax=Roseovarius maritimus TaxID=3342637 RepID=UPI00372A7D97